MFLNMSNLYLSYNTATLLLGIFSREIKCISTQKLEWMFIAALFLITQTQKQAKWPPTDKSVQFTCWVVSDSLQPRGLQHTRHPCPWPADKQSLVYPYNGTLWGNKKSHADVCHNMDEAWKYYTTWKKTVMKGHILYDSADMTCLE